MNIFAVDRDPVAAAHALCDRHVVKMVLETAQILCTVVASLGGRTPYRPTHRNHPCVIWAAASGANFRWLQRHGIALAEEFTRRYGGRHQSEKVIRWAEKRGPRGGVRRQPFVQAMPEQYRGPDPVAAYRRYYQGEKARICTWKTRPPSWWKLDSDGAGRYIGRNGQAAPRAAQKAQRDRARPVYGSAGVGGGGARGARSPGRGGAQRTRAGGRAGARRGRR